MANEPLMDSQLTLIAPLDHPSYTGHFPGNPVVPGVLLLEMVVQALDRGAPQTIIHTKFHRALKPGESFALAWKSAGDRSTFRCSRAAVLVAEGSLVFGHAP
jgi:3-hydroxyacyl-[acyl-carrier-protein] dehydratase